jgi:RNA polymerase sigma-70 factor (ECF subfamily)
MDERGEITQLLSAMNGGNPDAAARLLPLVYKELRKLAASLMRRERPGHTLQPTAVVHEAYLRLIDNDGLAPQNRAHFFAVAARSMRQVLVDHARRKLADKRGGDAQQVELEEDLVLSSQQSEEILALHEALDQLEKLDPQQARIIEMHYFAGNGVSEIAEVLGVSERTVKRELQTARFFLRKQLGLAGLSLP